MKMNGKRGSEVANGKQNYCPFQIQKSSIEYISPFDSSTPTTTTEVAAAEEAD
jgi:hypothetical protein